MFGLKDHFQQSASIISQL